MVYILTLAFHLCLTQENIGNHTMIESNIAHYHLVLENNIWSTKSMIYRINMPYISHIHLNPAFSFIVLQEHCIYIMGEEDNLVLGCKCLNYRFHYISVLPGLCFWYSFGNLTLVFWLFRDLQCLRNSHSSRSSRIQLHLTVDQKRWVHCQLLLRSRHRPLTKYKCSEWIGEPVFRYMCHKLWHIDIFFFYTNIFTFRDWSEIINGTFMCICSSQQNKYNSRFGGTCLLSISRECEAREIISWVHRLYEFETNLP